MILSAGPSGQSVLFSLDGQTVLGTPSCAAALGGRDVRQARLPGLSRSLAEDGIDLRQVSRLEIINGMGMAIGDAIIGLQAVFAVKDRLVRRGRGLSVRLWRPAVALPEGVRRVHELSGFRLARLPVDPEMARAMGDTWWLDLADLAFRPDFNARDMYGFFSAALGVTDIDGAERAPRWLARALPSPPRPWCLPRRYALVCAGASQPLRAIPDSIAVDLAGRLHRLTGLPVAGLGFRIDAPWFVALDGNTPRFDDFAGAIAHAACCITADSSACHIAAAYDRPALTLFTSVAPWMQIEGYPLCRGMLIDPASVSGKHWHTDEGELRTVVEAWSRWSSEMAQMGSVDAELRSLLALETAAGKDLDFAIP